MTEARIEDHVLVPLNVARNLVAETFGDGDFWDRVSDEAIGEVFMQLISPRD